MKYVAITLAVLFIISPFVWLLRQAYLGKSDVQAIPLVELPPLFDGARAYDHVEAQCNLGPRPTGTEANRATGDYIFSHLQAHGWTVEGQHFIHHDTPVRNVVGRAGDGPVLILGAHYDTRRVADEDDSGIPVMGANDGASGVAVLLELARVLAVEKLPYEVWLTFFDAEDNGGLDDWPWCVGSQYMANHLEVDPLAVVVVDMVGDVDQAFYYESNSDLRLQRELWDVAAGLGYGDVFLRKKRWTIYDDHVPFAERGIPAAVIIDFDYAHWHTAQDTRNKVSAESLERVGRVLEAWLESSVGKGEVR